MVRFMRIQYQASALCKMKVDEKILLSIMEFIKTTKALKEMKNFFQRPFCFQAKTFRSTR